ncbi:glycosyltransferase family 2 protein [Spiribacter halobius]|uniref:Glycosyltransferase family 2 protein n=1 Tax=Sediminicurvatus halobius TaxID=2182432 RepID=A0A2U2N178_9GAMM|nr:glycosyltransferase family 2 protein [Spiribacter halobius]
MGRSGSSRLTVLILTKDEELHISRCIKSVKAIADRVCVVDSGSNDETVAIAKALGAEVWEKSWVNYASQFNWALRRIADPGTWVLRLDADEVVSAELAREVGIHLGSLSRAVCGVRVRRRMAFLGRPIRYGGVFPIRVTRLFRWGHGWCEKRWMDEHIVVEGDVVEFRGELLDDNRKSLTWWIEKHNAYASREVVDILGREHGFLREDMASGIQFRDPARTKRWMKERVYLRLPVGARAFLYFAYRYVLRFGFLDGQKGAAFHFFQGFWYRYLVDMKLLEVKWCMRSQGMEPEHAIRHVLGIDVYAAP